MKRSLTILTVLSISLHTFSQSKPDLAGYWLQEGYGVYMEIENDSYKIYDVTKMSCQQSAQSSLNSWTGPLDVLLDLYSIESFNEKSLIIKYGITDYKFNRLDAPLAICSSVISSSDDPRLNFDILWHTFKENYAYSELRGVDWDKIYADHDQLINENTTEVQLYGYIGEILNDINDEHISLRVPHKISEAYMKIRVAPDSGKIDEESQEQVVEEKLSYGELRSLAMEKIEVLFSKTKFRKYHKDLLVWGKLTETTGYIQINGMNGFTSSIEVPEKHKSSKYWDKHWSQVFKSIDKGKTVGEYLRGELDGANTQMELILGEFSSTDNLIIDLRFNPGGTDQVAIDILSYFTKQEKELFKKKAQTGVQSTIESTVYATPAKKYYGGKVALLTSPQTGSSAETMVLGSLEFQNIVRVGSPTMGIFSDVLQKSLPNGWRYGLSNEIYETSTGNNYEYKGIPPTTSIEYSKHWAVFYRSILALETSDPAISIVMEVFEK